MEDIFNKASSAAQYIESKIDAIPTIAMSLGTGSSILLDKVKIEARIPYADIPHFPHSTVATHVNELIVARIGSVLVFILAGRMHYYEGWSTKELTFPVRVMQALKVNKLLLSNAAGALNPSYTQGEIILLKDHINLMPDHPLRGKNDERLGLRFPDMSKGYSASLREMVKMDHAEIKEGVYVGFQGPSLETPAEYKMLHIIGGDLVGMSTVPEVIVANHAEMDVLVFSIATNICYPPENITETTLEEVVEVANQSSVKLVKLVELLLKRINSNQAES